MKKLKHGPCSQNPILSMLSTHPGLHRHFHRCLLGMLATVASALFFASTSLAQNLNDGLVVRFTFDGNANDVTGNGYNGIPANGAHLTTGKSGLPDTAFEFDGIDDFIAVSNSTNLNFTTNGFTLAAWASFAASTNINGAILAKHFYGSPPGFLLGVYSNQTLAQFFMSDSRLLNPVESDASLWHFLVATYDGSIQRLYVDGNLKMSVYASYSPAETAELSIGSATGGGNFQGKIDDIRIYNRALSAEEILRLYTLDSDTSTGLIAHYPLNANGTNVLGTGNNGTPNGAVPTTDRAGITNGAYALDGTNDLTLPSGPPVASTSSFTYAFWMLSTFEGAYPTNPPNTWRWLLDRTGTTDPLCSLGVLTDAIGTNAQGQFWFLPRYDDNTQPPGNNELGAGIVGGALTPQVWQQITMVRDYSNSFRLYVDGNLVGSAPDNGHPLTLPAVVLGRNPNHGDPGLVGKIDDFRIYARALTPADATALYYDGPPWFKALPAAPVGHPGDNLDLCLTVIGSLSLSYQWSLNGNPVVGQTGSCLELPNVQPNQAGSYSLLVSNALGSANFSVAISVLDLKVFAGLVLAGPVGSNYRIEFVPALGNANAWQTLTNVTLTVSPSIFFDVSSPSATTRFYRAIPLP